MMNMSEMLNTSQDFNALLESTCKIQSDCKDYKVAADAIRMDDTLNLNFEDKSLPLSSLATGHLCGKLNVPSRYFGRLVDCSQH